MRVTRHPYEIEGWGVGELWIGDGHVVVAHDPPTPGVRLHGAGSSRPHADVLVLSGPVSSLDALVARLVVAGVAVRELAPVVTPLEAAFLALTDRQDEADGAA